MLRSKHESSVIQSKAKDPGPEEARGLPRNTCISPDPDASSGLSMTALEVIDIELR